MSNSIWKNLIDAGTAERATELVIAERERQERKWGQQEVSDELMATILLEEFGEVAKEMNDVNTEHENFVVELTQLTAVAHKWLEAELSYRNSELWFIKVDDDDELIFLAIVGLMAINRIKYKLISGNGGILFRMRESDEVDFMTLLMRKFGDDVYLHISIKEIKPS